jgi:hypothetical protein
LKEFLTSVEGMENLSDINNVDFISINRLFTKNSGRWTKKISLHEPFPGKWDSSINTVKSYDLMAKSHGLEQEKKNEENILVRMFEKLLNVIDERLKQNRSVNHIIHTFENNFYSSLESLSEETFIRLEAEIEKRKKIEYENMI